MATAYTYYFKGAYYTEGALLLSPQNRSFMYGDGVFESIALVAGQMPLWQWHLQRLLASLKKLHYTITETEGDLLAHIAHLHASHGLPTFARLRIAVFRTAGGLYTPKNKCADVLISYQPCNNALLGFNMETKVNLGYLPQLDGLAYKPAPYQHLKVNAALNYVYAAQAAQLAGFDDVIICDSNKYIVETSNSTLFFMLQGALCTPDLAGGGVAGVYRAAVLDLAKQYGLPLQVRPISISEARLATAIYLTNAVSGVRCAVFNACA